MQEKQDKFKDDTFWYYEFLCPGIFSYQTNLTLYLLYRHERAITSHLQLLLVNKCLNYCHYFLKITVHWSHFSPVLRDISERGRDLESILAQYITFVKPAFEEFCLPVSAVPHVL